MLYLELLSRPLRQSWETAPAITAALAERCSDNEVVTFVLMRTGCKIRAWLGVPDRCAEQAILECRRTGYGYRAGKDRPAIHGLARSILRREMSTQTLPRSGQSAVIAALPRSIAPEPEQMEALLYALENVSEGSGAALYFRPSKGLNPAIAAELSKLVSPVEQSVSLELLRAPRLYDAVCCAFAPDDASARVLESELAFALQMQAFPLASAQSVSPALLDAPFPTDSRLSPLRGQLLPREMYALGKLLCASEHYGIPINKDSLAGKILPTKSSENAVLKFGDCDDGRTPVSLPLSTLQKHLILLSPPGGGKGNQLALTAAQLHENGVPFLFVESAKEELHALASVIPNLQLWRPEAGKFAWNIFAVPPGVTLGRYIASLQQILRNVFRMDGPLEELFGTTMRSLYAKNGWTDLSKTGDRGTAPFGLDEFMREYQRMLIESGYDGKTKADMMTAGIVRLRRLFDANSLVFDTERSVPVSLFAEDFNVLQLSPLATPGAKQMFMSMLLLSLAAYLRCTFSHHSGDRPRLVIAIDESHNLLCAQQTVNETAFSFAEDMEALLLECRSLGVGFIICDQFCDNLSEGIRRMCATKVFLGPNSSNLAAFRDETGADDNLLRHMYLLNPGEGMISTAKQPQPVFFRSINVIDELLRCAAGCNPANVRNDWLKKNPTFVVETYRSCAACPARGKCTIQTKAEAAQIADDLWQKTGKMLASSEEIKDAKARSEAQRKAVAVISAHLAGKSESVFHCAVTQYYRKYRRESRINTRVSEQTLRRELGKAHQKGATT